MNKIFKIIFILLLSIFSFPELGNADEEKIKIGLLVPITGDNKDLGQLIIKSTRMALNDIRSNKIEIYPKDTNSNPNKTLQSALQLKEMGVKIVIGPIFYKNLESLNNVEGMTFLSLTNKTENLPKNVVSSGVNATSQLNAIKKFLESNDFKKTIFLTPKFDFETEVKKSIKESKIKISNNIIFIKSPPSIQPKFKKLLIIK